MHSSALVMVCIFLSVGLVVADHWQALEHHVTNAERFAEGLPPLPPKKSKKHRTHGHKHRKSRGVIPVALTGRIEVYSADGSLIGFVGPEASSGYLSLITNYASALVASYHPPTSSDSLTDLVIKGARFKYAGFTSHQSAIEQNPGSAGFAFLTSVGAPTGLGSPPFVADLSDDSHVAAEASSVPIEHETTIWELDTSTNFLIPHWFNPDGQIVGDLELVYVRGIQDIGFAITAQADALEQHFAAEDPSASLSPVNLKFAPVHDLFPTE